MCQQHIQVARMSILIVHVLLVMLVNTGFGEDKKLCPLCDCCKNYCTQSVCPDGCIDGYWDNDQHKDCRNPCLPGCQRCTNGTVCDACKDGYYGNQCNNTCFNNNCKTCNDSISCLTCMDGHYGDQCNKTCSNNNCKTCNDSISCLTCIDGKYWFSCEQDCNVGCKNNTCNLLGTCECKEDYAGNKCERCRDGRYGDTCGSSCSTACLTCNSSSNCLSCNTGYYGESCNFTCPVNCMHEHCTHTGFCETCKSGYVGIKCDSKCPDHCLMCDSQTNCSKCETGYYGTICQNNCLNCGGEGHCFKENGVCSESCADGYSSVLCNVSCSTNCTTCLRGIHFNCTVCKNGTYGHVSPNSLRIFTCDRECPPRCRHNKCDMQYGHCNNGCMDYFYGDNCTNTCSRNCLNGACEQKNGTCHDCIAGYHGDVCDCPINCNCDKLAGSTYDRCIQCNDGFYPLESGNCVPCPEGCAGGICNTRTGYCIEGCKTGYHGSICDDVCNKGCRNRNCNQTSGFCINGCQSGFLLAGNTCVTEQVPGSLIAGAIGGAVGIIVIIVICGVVCWFCLIRTDRNSADVKKQTKNDIEMIENRSRGQDGQQKQTDTGPKSNAPTDDDHEVVENYLYVPFAEGDHGNLEDDTAGNEYAVINKEKQVNDTVAPDDVKGKGGVLNDENVDAEYSTVNKEKKDTRDVAKAANLIQNTEDDMTYYNT